MRSQLRNLAVFVFLAIFMVALGRYVGEWTAPEGPISEDEVVRLIRNLDRPLGNRIDPEASQATAGLLVSAAADAHWPSVMEELKLAREFGVNTFVLACELPWSDEPWDAFTRLSEAIRLLPNAEIWLSLDLTPTQAWLDARPEEASTFLTEGKAYPSIGSIAWRDEASAALARASAQLLRATPAPRLSTVVLRGLEEGNWYRMVGFDHGQANTAAFQRWLEDRYGDAAALSEAWATEFGSFQEVETPDAPIDQKTIFFSGANGPAYVDYLAYLNETTAETVTFFADRVRESFGSNIEVLASYGSVFDLPWPEFGQWSLSRVLAGNIDGLAFGVVRTDRTLGAAGGLSGPATIPATHGKKWVLIDDTRTGISWNASTNSVFKPAGFEARTSAPIFDRNLGMAALEQGGIIWADARGQGNFLDRSIWDHFASRVAVLDEIQKHEFSSARTAMLVLDDNSMFHVADGERVGGGLINATRLALQQAGVAFGCVSFEDLLAERAPEARVFVFPNLFTLSDDKRKALHAYLADHGAAAIWLYAPGAIGHEDPADGVSATVGMKVSAYKEPAATASKFALSGNWIPENEPVDANGEWFPLFHIDDETADPLAKYIHSNDPSIAVKFMEQGWASVFVAIPTMTPPLLREILDILDHPSILRPMGPPRRQSIAMRDGYLLLHSSDAGDRVFDFGGRNDISDLFNPEAAWPDKRVLQVSLRAGESRLLRLTPSETADDDAGYEAVENEVQDHGPVVDGAGEPGVEADKLESENSPAEDSPDQP